MWTVIAGTGTCWEYNNVLSPHTNKKPLSDGHTFCCPWWLPAPWEKNKRESCRPTNRYFIQHKWLSGTVVVCDRYFITRQAENFCDFFIINPPLLPPSSHPPPSPLPGWAWLGCRVSHSGDSVSHRRLLPVWWGVTGNQRRDISTCTMANIPGAALQTDCMSAMSSVLDVLCKIVADVYCRPKRRVSSTDILIFDGVAVWRTGWPTSGCWNS